MASKYYGHVINIFAYNNNRLLSYIFSVVLIKEIKMKIL